MYPRNNTTRYLLVVCVLAATACRLGAAKEAKPTTVAANNTTQLRRSVGQQVIVRGKVSRTAKSRSGHHFLNFYSSEFTVVCFKEDVRRFAGGGPANIYRNKEVQVSGKLELFKNKPQIKLRRPQQIQLARADNKTTSSGGEQPQPEFKLKQIGETSWVSPAGVRYIGLDPQGLTRVEHVLRHSRDEPKRAGSHGVFDGGKHGTLASIDAAWKLAQTKGIKPRREGNRSSLLVPMGKRVGYLGGQAGAARGKPPLNKVFIVIKTGTSELITAFPR